MIQINIRVDSRFFKRWLFSIAFLAWIGMLSAQSITGTVYLDLNASGTKENTELGVQGIIVTAYNAAGTLAANTSTASDGTYTLSGLTNSQTYRVQFSTLPSGYFCGPKGSASGTSVQFVSASATNVNLGINYPSDYCQANPNLAIPCYEGGASTTSGWTSVASHPGIVSFPSTATGTKSSPMQPLPTKNAAFGNVGATWGGAWKKDTKRMFYAAVLKRHVDLGEFSRPNASNVQTVDGVYVVDYNGLTGTYAGGFRLQGVAGINLGTVNRSIKSSKISASSATDDNALSTANRQSRDLDAFAKIGKIGYGDIVMSEDYNYLWLVNLNQKTLIRVDVSNPAALPNNGGTVASSLVTTYPINFSALGSCNGQFRPWALSFHHGTGYVGVVCDASSGSASDLKAYVLSFDPENVAGGFTKVLEFNLDYTRENSAWPTSGNASYRLGTWRPWIDTWSLSSLSGEFSYAQPILSNIEFTADGSMVLGFIDRAGLQFDFDQLSPVSANSKLISIDAAGDIVHACKNGGIFTVEGAGSCVIDTDPGSPPSQALSNDGPGNVGEFYYNDHSSYNTSYHMEITFGGLAMLLGTQEVVSGAFDVITENFNQGVQFYSTSTGRRTDQYQITADLVNKGIGLGEPEVMCNPAPIEIGNYVWKDMDGDGVQDAGEPPLQGVTVKLYAADGLTVISTATTSTSGEYYFSSATGSSTASLVYGVNLLPNTQYFLKITSLGNHSSVAGLSLTGITTGGTSGLNDGSSIANNDAVVSGGLPTIQLETGFYGENNHNYDFGFGGCTVTATAIAGASTLCAGQTISLTATGGAAGATYTWSGPNNFTSTAQNPNIYGATQVNTGTYSVTITNSPGCSASASASVTVSEVTASATSTSGCVGETINLSATGGSTYSWSGPNGFSSTIQSPQITGATLSNAGIYTVQVTKNGCTAAANTVVSVTSATASITSNSPICAGKTLQLSASSGGATYTWSGPGGAVFSSTTDQNPTVTNVVAGTYSVTVTGGGCSGNANTSVVVNPVPTATVTKGALCEGESIQLHVTGGSAYQWSGPNGFSSTSANPVISPAASANTGTYSVTITGASTACSSAVGVNVFGGNISLTNYAEIISADQPVNSVTLANNSTTELDDAVATTELITCTKPAFSLAATSATCNGPTANEDASIAVTGISNGTRIGWSEGTTYTGPGFDDATALTGTSYSILNLPNHSASITYTIRIYNGGQCCLTEQTVTLHPASCAAASNSSPVCLGEAVKLYASGGLSYTWSGPNAFTSMDQNPLLSGITSAMAGTYTVTVTSGPNTSTATTMVVITQPNATAAANSPVATGGTIYLEAEGGASYSWSGPNGFTSTVQNPVIAGATIPSSGTYIVTVTEASSCTATASVPVTVQNNPGGCTTAVTAGINSGICEGDDINLTASPSISGASYLWSGPNGYSSTSQNPVITNATDLHNTGIYSVTVTESSGCTAVSSVAVAVGNYPGLPVISGTTLVTAGDQIQLTVESEGATSFTWTLPDLTTSGGSTLTVSNAMVSQSGTYTVEVDNGSGCTVSESIAVEVRPTGHLILAKAADKSTVTLGSNETLVFTLTLTNAGSDPAPAVKVKDKLPTGLTYVSYSTANGTYDPVTGIWDVGTTPVGNVTLTITTTVQ